MTVSMHKTLAALKLPTPIPALLGVARAILLAMTGNPAFSAPTPSLAAVASALEDLRAAQVATLTRTRGTIAARNEKLAVLVGLLVRLKAYVQGVADEDPERAESLIESAGLTVKRKAAAAKPPFELRSGAASGSVRAIVRSAGDRAGYRWEWSTDGGQTWHPAPTTLQARTELSGFAPGATCSVRYLTITAAGDGEWSQPVALVVR